MKFIYYRPARSMLPQSTQGANQMANRTRKPARRPAAAVAHRFGDVPGAVFFGTLFRCDAVTNQHFENLEYARDLQCIRDDFEMDGCEASLWDDCLEMGLDSREIRRYVMNPSLITSCGYLPAIPLR